MKEIYFFLINIIIFENVYFFINKYVKKISLFYI